MKNIQKKFKSTLLQQFFLIHIFQLLMLFQIKFYNTVLSKRLKILHGMRSISGVKSKHFSFENSRNFSEQINKIE